MSKGLSKGEEWLGWEKIYAMKENLLGNFSTTFNLFINFMHNSIHRHGREWFNVPCSSCLWYCNGMKVTTTFNERIQPSTFNLRFFNLFQESSSQAHPLYFFKTLYFITTAQTCLYLEAMAYTKKNYLGVTFNSLRAIQNPIISQPRNDKTLHFLFQIFPFCSISFPCNIYFKS